MVSPFLSIPRELHFAIISYLSSTDLVSVSQTSPIIRPIYSQASWKFCTLTSNSSQKILYNPNDRPVDLRIFLNPTKYSWFSSQYVKNLNLIFGINGKAASNLFENFSKDIFKASYPNIRRIKWQIIGDGGDFAKILIPILISADEDIPNTLSSNDDNGDGGVKVDVESNLFELSNLSLTPSSSLYNKQYQYQYLSSSKIQHSFNYTVHLIIHDPNILNTFNSNSHLVKTLELSSSDHNSIEIANEVIPKYFTQLESLIFKFKFIASDDLYTTLITTVAENLTNLKSIEAHNCYFSRRFLEAVSKLPPDLQHCKLSFCDCEPVSSDEFDLDLDLHPSLQNENLLPHLSLPQVTSISDLVGFHNIICHPLMESISFPRISSAYIADEFNHTPTWNLPLKMNQIFLSNFVFLEIKFSDSNIIYQIPHLLLSCHNLETLRILRSMSPGLYKISRSFVPTPGGNINNDTDSPSSSKNKISEILNFIRLKFSSELISVDNFKLKYFPLSRSVFYSIKDNILNSDTMNQENGNPQESDGYWQDLLQAETVLMNKQKNLKKSIKDYMPSTMLDFDHLSTILDAIIEPTTCKCVPFLGNIRVFGIQLGCVAYWEQLGFALMNNKKLKYLELGYFDSWFQRENSLREFSRCDIRPLDCPRFHNFVTKHPSLNQLILVNCSTHHVDSISQSEELTNYTFGPFMKKGARAFSNQVDTITIIDREADRSGYTKKLQSNEHLDYYIKPKRLRQFKWVNRFNEELITEGLDDIQNFSDGWK